LLTDGLKSEREQGITIDVAYRHFSTPKRRFIIADTPGHEQYTRNMATGSSTSSLALILIDATKGVVTQTKRHTFISSMLGIKHVIVAVNKMDLVQFSEEVFNTIANDYRAFSDKLVLESIQFIPLSALHGDNVLERSNRMPWYHGLSLLDYLETITISTWRNLIDFRFPVQYIKWGGSGSGLRGYCGTIASGIIRPGEAVMVLPSRKESKVKKIVTFDGDLPYAYAPQPVTLYLEDDIDISRGDMIVRKKNFPSLAWNIESNLVWMDDNPLELVKTYLIKHTTHSVRGVVEEVIHRFDPEDLHRKPADSLHLNEIGRVSIRLLSPVYADSYATNRQTGSFIIIDPLTYRTSAAGMITRCHCRDEDRYKTSSTRAQTYWYVGNPGTSRKKYANMSDEGYPCIYLDDQILAQGMCHDVSGPDQRDLWLERVSYICKLANDAGIPVIIESINSPDGSVRNIIGEKNIIYSN
jgi:sulfate adenylyltransferase large subunit